MINLKVILLFLIILLSFLIGKSELSNDKILNLVMIILLTLIISLVMILLSMEYMFNNIPIRRDRQTLQTEYKFK